MSVVAFFSFVPNVATFHVHTTASFAALFFFVPVEVGSKQGSDCGWLRQSRDRQKNL